MRTVLTCTLLAALFQQAPPPPPRDRRAPDVTREGTGTIKGRVYDRETGAPVPNAAVTLTVDVASARDAAPSGQPYTVSGPALPRQATTDAQGRYAFERLPAGSYLLTSVPPEYKVTYLPLAYGAARPSDPMRPPPRRPIPLADGQTLDNLDLPLWRSLAITGRVTDEYGEPLAGVPIVATTAGTNQRAGARGPYQIYSDDRGAFRLFGMAPGRYVVCASPQGLMGGGRPEESSERYMKTCAPSAASEADGQVVELAAGDFDNVEIRMARGRAYKVTGTAIDSQGKPVNQVSIVRTEGNGFTSSGSQSDGNGRFTFTGLLPGDYIIVARVGNMGMVAADTAENEIGSAAVHVEGADVENLVVSTSKGATVTGRIIVEGTAPPPAKGLRVMLRPAPGAASGIFGPLPNSEVAADLTFTLKGIFGAYGVTLSGLPGGWIVKSVRLGGEDVTERTVDLRGKDRFEIVLSNRPAGLTGRVVLAPGEAAPDYRVLLIPADKEQWNSITSQRSAPTTSAGTFKLTAIRPGEYFVALVPAEEMPSPLNAAAAYERIVKLAQRVTFTDDEQKEIELTIPR